MQKSKKNFRKTIGDNGCECCGYDDYKQILTLHHMYPKRNGNQSCQAEGKSRRERYLCVCPNCHVLIELGIINAKKVHKKIIISHNIKDASCGGEDGQ